MNIVLAFILALLDPTTPELAAGALRTAPEYLTPATAMQHALAAQVAARTSSLPNPSLLLSIAWHESRYGVDVRTPEVGGRESCGVMTPTPVARCHHESLVDSYIAGARHLETWMVAMHGDVRAALTGYAGGYRLLATCATGSDVRGCHVADVFLERARRIRARRRES